MTTEKFYNFTEWLKDTVEGLKSKPLDDDFYYDDYGVIRNYEKSIDNMKIILRNRKEQMDILKKIHETRMSNPLHRSFYEDINKLEKDLMEFKYNMERKELLGIHGHIQTMKHIVALSKIMGAIIAETPKNSKMKDILVQFHRFQLRYEETIQTLKDKLDEKLGDKDKENQPHR